MTIRKRVSKKGITSYQFRVSLGYKDGQQIVKCMTGEPRIQRRSADRQMYDMDSRKRDDIKTNQKGGNQAKRFI